MRYLVYPKLCEWNINKFNKLKHIIQYNFKILSLLFNSKAVYNVYLILIIALKINFNLNISQDINKTIH